MTKDLAFNFDHSYQRLPKNFYSQSLPDKPKNPKLVIFNQSLAKNLGLEFDHLKDQDLAAYFSGKLLPYGANPISQSYAGHQFAHFTILGDGRAHLIGEHISPNNKRYDIAFKGSGKTIYSRSGDGKAALGPMLREYLISEAMHGLRIKSTRSLAVVKTEEIIFREKYLKAAILTRVAKSHIRIGTFQYFLAFNDLNALKKLADYTIDRHYPDLKQSDNPYLALISELMQKQIDLMVHWLRVGFVHGVLNTDNISLAAETIDFGPCAFMDSYHPDTVFSSIDHHNRYAYGKQPQIIQWNLARFAETLIGLIDNNQQKALDKATTIIESFQPLFEQAYNQMMAQKLGLSQYCNQDHLLIKDLLVWMQKNKADYTNTFKDLTQFIEQKNTLTQSIYKDQQFKDWLAIWQQRLKKQQNWSKRSLDLMKKNNPVLIPRNYLVEKALIKASEYNDLSDFKKLNCALKNPYQDSKSNKIYQKTPSEKEQTYTTYCGT